jgi:hypothetical protein
MRTYLLPLALLFCTCGLHAQNKSKETYLSVKIVSGYNYTKEETYYSLAVDKGNTFAGDLYELKTYKSKLKAEDSVCRFYEGGEVDTAKLYFNYFVSESAALSFIGGMGWKLVTVNSHLSFSPNYPAERIYDNVFSSTSYYFKKEIE